MNIVIFNQQGKILRCVSCPDSEIQNQVVPGELWLAGVADPSKHVVDVATGRVVDAPPAPPPAAPAPTYVDLRKALYPTLQDQLDMLWHAMDSGSMPAIEPFYSSIRAVKDAVPKGEAAPFTLNGS